LIAFSLSAIDCWLLDVRRRSTTIAIKHSNSRHTPTPTATPMISADDQPKQHVVTSHLTLNKSVDLT
jgi:hypothetical protein